MTLAETCDRIEAALEELDVLENLCGDDYSSSAVNWCSECLTTLVELGETKHPRHTRWSSEFRETCERFEALKARVEEAVGK